MESHAVCLRGFSPQAPLAANAAAYAAACACPHGGFAFLAAKMVAPGVWQVLVVSTAVALGVHGPRAPPMAPLSDAKESGFSVLATWQVPVGTWHVFIVETAMDKPCNNLHRVQGDTNNAQVMTPQVEKSIADHVLEQSPTGCAPGLRVVVLKLSGYIANDLSLLRRILKIVLQHRRELVAGYGLLLPLAELPEKEQFDCRHRRQLFKKLCRKLPGCAWTEDEDKSGIQMHLSDPMVFQAATSSCQTYIDEALQPQCPVPELRVDGCAQPQ